MTVTERTRHERHEALVDRLGPEQAETLMELLAPVGWADVATKHDLRAIEERLDLRLEALENRLLSAIDQRLRQTNVTIATIVVSLSAVMITTIVALR